MMVTVCGWMVQLEGVWCGGCCHGSKKGGTLLSFRPGLEAKEGFCQCHPRLLLNHTHPLGILLGGRYKAFWLISGLLGSLSLIFFHFNLWSSL